MTEPVGGSYSRPTLSLLTDFGMTDPFVAEMKSVIFSICPRVRIIDISHLVEKFNIRMGAFILASASPYFPPSTVHVAVVDPGVGSKRRPIVVETKRSLYVGPDNGLLIPAAQSENAMHVYEVTNRSLMRDPVSATFHGRDIFAPVGAYLACGKQPKDCGSEIQDYLRPSYSEPTFKGRAMVGEVFHVDSFGNVVTNLKASHLSRLNLKPGQSFRILLGRNRVRVRLVSTYWDLRTNEIGLLVSSHGFVEIACREKSAARKVGAKIGMTVQLLGA